MYEIKKTHGSHKGKVRIKFLGVFSDAIGFWEKKRRKTLD